MTNIELYNKAKQAYYEGNPIMGDSEFDELEKSINLENKGSIGSSSENYTVEHPFIMGSLSKVQIKEDKDKHTDWDGFVKQIKKYVCKNRAHWVVVTPKFDGCSFEAVVIDGKLKSVSTRGDGNFGKDIQKHIYNKVINNVEVMMADYNETDFMFRGEVLINKDTFDSKYASEFANTRAFVAGTLNAEYNSKRCDDLDIVIYDIRILTESDWEQKDFFEYNLPDNCDKYNRYEFDASNNFQLQPVYTEYEQFRKNYKYALDGFVIKPVAQYRENKEVTRPKDCVAVKFKPSIEKTKVTGFEWNLGKSGEYSPVVIFEPIYIDGKEITRASGHNYGYINENNLGIGSEISVSMAGDIIPFIYEINSTPEFFDIEECNIPSNYFIDGVHMMMDMDQDGINYQALYHSILSAEINGIGDAAAKAVCDYVVNNCQGDDFFDEEKKEMPVNIMQLTTDDFINGIGGKNGIKIGKAFDKWKSELTIKKALLTLNMPFCGHRVSEQLENWFLDKPYDFTSMALQGYDWCISKLGMYDKFIEYLKCAGYTVDSFKTTVTENTGNQIPVIMTGEPNDYKSKSEFLQRHPEYRNTTSWKEVKIVFTNDLDSNTGKMKKAREKNIEIRLY